MKTSEKVLMVIASCIGVYLPICLLVSIGCGISFMKVLITSGTVIGLLLLYFLVVIILATIIFVSGYCIINPEAREVVVRIVKNLLLKIKRRY